MTHHREPLTRRARSGTRGSSTSPTILRSGPNSVRHFDQSMQAVASLPGTLADKLDVITAVDEYVFGFCIHERNDFHDDETDDYMLDYVE